MFIMVFGGITTVRLLLLNWYPDCFLFEHMWLLYLAYFLIICAVLFTMVPTVPLATTSKKVEFIMLGNGNLTNEVFDKNRYRNYRLISRTEMGNAYSSETGEMIYTKIRTVNSPGGETALSVFFFAIIYTIALLYMYEIIYGLIDGSISLDEHIRILKKNFASLNLLSDKYPIKDNLIGAFECLKVLGHNLVVIVKDILRFIF